MSGGLYHPENTILTILHGKFTFYFLNLFLIKKITVEKSKNFNYIILVSGVQHSDSVFYGLYSTKCYYTIMAIILYLIQYKLAAVL